MKKEGQCAGTEMMCKRKKRSDDERKPCVCGCGCLVTNFLHQGGDQTLRGLIVREMRGTLKETDHPEKVLWCSIPLCFRGGEFAKQIKKHHDACDCEDRLGFEPIEKERPCLCDKNPT